MQKEVGAMTQVGGAMREELITIDNDTTRNGRGARMYSVGRLRNTGGSANNDTGT